MRGRITKRKLRRLILTLGKTRCFLAGETDKGLAKVGALTILGVQSNPHHGAANFNVTDTAQVLATFYPMGWFGNNPTASGSAVYKGDLEA